MWQAARFAAVKRKDMAALRRLSRPVVREAAKRNDINEVAALIESPLSGEQQLNAPEVTAAQLARARVEDPEAYRSASHMFAGRFFAHHDERRAGGGARSFWDGLTDADKARLGRPAG